MKSLKPCAVISVSASYITVPGSGYLTGTLPEGAMVGTVHATDLPWLKEVYSNISNHKDFKLTLFRKVEVTRVHYDALQVEVFHLVNESLGEGQGADLGQMKFANLASCMRLKLPSRQRDNVECRWKCAAAIPGTDKSAARVRRRESRAGAPSWVDLHRVCNPGLPKLLLSATHLVDSNFGKFLHHDRVCEIEFGRWCLPRSQWG